MGAEDAGAQGAWAFTRQDQVRRLHWQKACLPDSSSRLASPQQ